MTTNNTNTPSQSVLVPPPQSTGNPQQDLPLIINWMYLLYQILQVNGTFVTQASQVQANSFNPTSLPDPSASNIATAQTTANNAYSLANEANTQANAADALATTANTRTVSWETGSVEISGASTSAVAAFTTAQADTNYQVFVTPVTISGAPTLGSTLPKSIAKATGGFTLNVAVAPGGVAAVTFDFLVVRIP